jgi:histone acetyltransferase (RNA polymerase elongator complex component)
MAGRHVVIPIFVPHEGCPFDCIFCNQKKISGRKEQMSVEAMRDIIRSHLRTVRPGTNLEIGFYGGSFTGIDRELQLSYLSTAFEYVRAGSVSAVRLSTRPDYIDEDILDYLSEYGVRTIELGVQSLDEGVLEASCRGHDAQDVYRASSLIREKGFALGLQTMVGLPGDTREKDIDTAWKVISLKPEFVRIYPVLVIRGTYLEKLLLDGSYAPPTLEEAVGICAELLETYEASGIKVIRIGLQASRDISEGSEVAAGPVHPAFRQLVESRLALKRMEEGIIKQKLAGVQSIVIQTGTSNISNIIGLRKENIKYLERVYSIGNIKVQGSTEYYKEIFLKLNNHF